MIRALFNLGRSPLARRVIAGIILIAGALIAAFARYGDRLTGFELGTHLVMALLALMILHLRWRRRERQQISPATARDIFS